MHAKMKINNAEMYMFIQKIANNSYVINHCLYSQRSKWSAALILNNYAIATLENFHKLKNNFIATERP